MLGAIRRRVEAGFCVPAAFVTNSNTGTENPSMDIYAKAMITESEVYFTRLGLPITVVKVEPSLTSSFAYATLGRGKLPVFAGASQLLGRLEAAPAAESAQATAFEAAVSW